MFGSAKEVWQESRRNLRINERLPVQWQIKDSHLRGKGRVLNVSAGGALLEAETSVAPMERCVFAIESFLKGNKNFLPGEGRLVWFRHIGWGKKRILCGIEFIQPSDDIVTKLRNRIQAGVDRIANAQRFRTAFGVVLILAMMAMTAFVITQYRQNYQNIQASHDIIVSSYDQQMKLTQTYAADFLETKALLEESRKLLSEAKVENAVLADLMSAKDSQYAASSQKIADLQERNVQLQKRNSELAIELAAITERLDFLEGDVNGISEGQEALSLYKKKIREVRKRIKGFKMDAHYAKIAAQKERDRLESLIGNNGFLMKNGESHRPDPKALEQSRQLKIDVKFHQ